ncbi:hypothetical protein PVC01_000048700 [Plasmodium vivax]|uniref:VIR protein n=1 Tax=Plasmodium vivax TaxID=5855 RepID=A0A1G4E978_PLAVI|nr:hypothetical protein PVC01_000048700 [Plasmodium vivax]
MVVSFYDISDSFTNYKTLFVDNAENETEHFNESCKNIKAKFYIDRNYFDNLCKSSMKYLKDLEIKHSSPLEKTQGCIYFYYYLPDDLFKEDVYHYKKLSIYKDFLREYASISKTDIWENYEKYISDDNLLKIKDLFDLYNNFNKFKHDDSCECANKCVDIYNRLIVECYIGINGDFCKEIEKFKEKFNDYRSTIEFTPCISSFRSFKKRKRETKHNIYQESNELQYYSKKPNMDFENTTYNIKYHNAQKS